MLDEAIVGIEALEHSIKTKSSSDLEARLALRSCLKELRYLATAETLARRPIFPPTQLSAAS